MQALQSFQPIPHGHELSRVARHDPPARSEQPASSTSTIALVRTRTTVGQHDTLRRIRCPTRLTDEDILGALDRLPVPFQEVIMLSDVEELTYKEIADALDDSFRNQ